MLHWSGCPRVTDSFSPSTLQSESAGMKLETQELNLKKNNNRRSNKENGAHRNSSLVFNRGVLYQLQNKDTKSTSAESVMLVYNKNPTISTIIYSDPMTNKWQLIHNNMRHKQNLKKYSLT